MRTRGSPNWPFRRTLLSFVPEMTRNDLIFGRRPVLEMLENGNRPDKILVQSGIDASFLSRLRAMAKPLDVQVQTVPWQKLKSLTKANHQGVIAFKAWVEYQRAADVVHHLYEDGQEPFMIMLDRITDVRNLGAIARSAEIFGAHGLILPATGSAPVNGEAVKASAGAMLNLAICRERSLQNTAVVMATSPSARSCGGWAPAFHQMMLSLMVESLAKARSTPSGVESTL